MHETHTVISGDIIVIDDPERPLNLLVDEVRKQRLVFGILQRVAFALPHQFVHLFFFEDKGQTRLCHDINRTRVIRQIPNCFHKIFIGRQCIIRAQLQCDLSAFFAVVHCNQRQRAHMSHALNRKHAKDSQTGNHAGLTQLQFGFPSALNTHTAHYNKCSIQLINILIDLIEAVTIALELCFYKSLMAQMVCQHPVSHLIIRHITAHFNDAAAATVAQLFRPCMGYRIR